ncbi:MAG: hypothetical protein WDN25_11240 [Acetobacteraceae bacterium]
MAEPVDDVFTLSPGIRDRFWDKNRVVVDRILLPLICYHGGSNDPAVAVSTLRADADKLHALEQSVAALAEAAGAMGAPAPGSSPAPVAAPIVPKAYMWVSPSISGAILLGFFVMLGVLMTRDAAAVEKLGGLQNVLFTLLGALAAAFTQVVNYWLGSSKGSADKTDLLERTIRPPADGGQATPAPVK